MMNSVYLYQKNIWRMNMRVYSENDYRSYQLIYNFVYLYPEVKKNEYMYVEDPYYKNFVLKVIWRYRHLKEETNISALKQFYDGKILALLKINEFPPLKKGFSLTDNRVFDYDLIIKRCESSLIPILNKAEDEMSYYYYNAIKKVGYFFAYKELIKICLLFKGCYQNE